MHAERIIGIKKIGTLPTLDIEVKSKDHIFYGNGIATSNSHGIGYGSIGYLTAFTKYHFPLHFFTAWLRYARFKQKPYEEIQDLASECKLFNIKIGLPLITNYDSGGGDVYIDKDMIRFGIRCIKRIGDASINQFLTKITEKEHYLNKPIKNWTWFEFLMNVGSDLSSTTINGLISAGVLDHFNISRNQMLYDYRTIEKLSKTQIEKIKSYKYNSIEDRLSQLILDVPNRQSQKIEDLLKVYKNPPHALDDKVSWIIRQERESYGIPITHNPIDVLNKGTNSDTTCKEFADGKTGNMTISVELEDVRPYKIKSGNNKGRRMTFLKLSDGTCSIDGVVFSEETERYADILYKGNILFMSGIRSNRNSFIMKKAYELV